MRPVAGSASGSSTYMNCAAPAGLLDGTVPSRSHVGSMVQNSTNALAVASFVSPNSTPIRKSPLARRDTLRTMHRTCMVVTPERVGIAESNSSRSLTTTPIWLTKPAPSAVRSMMLTARSPSVAGSDETTRAVRRSCDRRARTRSRSSEIASDHSDTISSDINDDCGSSPSVWVSWSLTPRTTRMALSPTTAITKPAPYCGLGRATIGERRTGRSCTERRLRQAAPIECNDQRARSPGRSVQPLSKARPNEVYKNAGSQPNAKTVAEAWKGTEPARTAEPSSVRNTTRRRPDSGRTAHAMTARRWVALNDGDRSTPALPNTIRRAARARCKRSSETACSELIGRCAITGTSLGAVIRQPADNNAAPANHCASSAGDAPRRISRSASVRTREPVPNHAALPRHPSAGFSERRSKSSSWRPFGPCSAESFANDTPMPCTTATRGPLKSLTSRSTMSPVGMSPASTNRNCGVRTAANMTRSPL